MDLLSLDTQEACENAVEFELVNPVNDEPTGIFLTVTGKDSAEYKALIEDMYNRDQKQEFQNRAKGKKGSPKNITQIKKDSLILISSTVQSWRQGEWVKNPKTKQLELTEVKKTLTFGKEELDCNQGNVKKLLGRLQWIADAVSDYTDTLENFMQT